MLFPCLLLQEEPRRKKHLCQDCLPALVSCWSFWKVVWGIPQPAEAWKYKRRYIWGSRRGNESSIDLGRRNREVLLDKNRYCLYFRKFASHGNVAYTKPMKSTNASFWLLLLGWHTLRLAPRSVAVTVLARLKCSIWSLSCFCRLDFTFCDLWSTCVMQTP